MTKILTAEDFQPIQRKATAELIVRPSLSYWQDAWRRLGDNRRALWSLYLIVALLAFAFVLPLIVKLDPESQDLTQISQGPSLSRTSLVVDTAPWQGYFVDAASAVETKLAGLKTAAEPHTESVRLVWEPVKGAAQYNVYRHILKPSGLLDLGLPLGATEYSGQVYYEDRLKLKTDPYHYSVVALDSRDQI